MNSQINYRVPCEFEKMYVLNNHEMETLEQMASYLKLPPSWVSQFCKWMKIEPAKRRKIILFPMVKKVVKENGVKEKMIRPQAVYTNINSPYGIAS